MTTQQKGVADECKCITQELRILVFDKDTKLWQKIIGWNDFPIHEECLTIHANSIKELREKTNEIKQIFVKEYSNKEVVIRV